MQDSLRINSIKLLADSYLGDNMDSVLNCYERLLQFGKEKENRRACMDAYSWKAKILKEFGNIDEALSCNQKSLNIGIQLGDTVHVTMCYSVFGSIYFKATAYAKALENFQQVLRLSSKINFTEGFLRAYFNMGAIYYFQENYDMALKYWEMSLSLYPNPESNSALDLLYNNIGVIYEQKGLHDTAMTYFLKSMDLRKITNNKPGLAASYLNIGTNYLEIEKYKTASSYIDTAYNLYKTLNDYLGLSASHYSRGELYWKTQKYNMGIVECKQGLWYSEKIDEVMWQRDNCDCLSKNYQAIGNYKMALSYKKRYISFRDSIKNESTDRQIAQKEVEYEYKQKAELDSIHYAEAMKVQEAELRAQDIRLRNEKTYKSALGFGLFGVVLFLFLLYRRFVLAKEQKAEIEEKNKHITDSIQYAKRIQDAILTSERDMKKALDDYFIYYQPKDIVSGDFYWTFKPDENTIMVAVADCTGHGVPGAFMSMIGNALLNEAIVENGIRRTDEVLNTMRTQLIKSLDKGEGEDKSTDGMDITLVKLDKQTKKLTFSSGGHTLYIYSDGACKEEGGDLYPVGYFYGKSTPFTQKELSISTGDVIYLTSDGFADQFGGEKNKKLGYGRFRQLIEENGARSMEDQKNAFETTFNKWKGGNAQIDDVCVMGIRI